MHKGSLFSTSSPKLVSFLFDNSRSDRGGDASLCSLLAFPWWLVMFSLFSYVCSPPSCLLWRSACSGLCPFLNLIICFFDAEFYKLRVLEVSPLSDTSFANVFSYSVGCLFIFVDGFPCCAKAFWFNVVPFAFFFILLPLPEETHPKRKSSIFLFEITFFFFFKELGVGREKKRERIIEQLPLVRTPARGWTCSPGLGPDGNWTTVLWFVDDVQPTQPHHSGQKYLEFLFYP